MKLVGYKVHMHYNVYNLQYYFSLQVQTFCNTVLFISCNHMPYIYIYIYIIQYNIIKFANSPSCTCRGSTGQKPWDSLMTYQRFTALLFIYGSLILSGICYCLRVFWCAAARMSELELEQRTNIKFLVVS